MSPVGGSTAFSDTAPYPQKVTGQGMIALVQCLREHQMPVDFETASDQTGAGVAPGPRELFSRGADPVRRLVGGWTAMVGIHQSQ